MLVIVSHTLVRLPVDRDFVSDFDLMMAKKKEESSRKRNRRHNFEVINDSDDIIAELIVKMKEAAAVSCSHMTSVVVGCHGDEL